MGELRTDHVQLHPSQREVAGRPTQPAANLQRRLAGKGQRGVEQDVRFVAIGESDARLPAVGEEVVREANAAARTERHAFHVELLRTATFRTNRQRLLRLVIRTAHCCSPIAER